MQTYIRTYIRIQTYISIHLCIHICTRNTQGELHKAQSWFNAAAVFGILSMRRLAQPQ